MLCITLVLVPLADRVSGQPPLVPPVASPVASPVAWTLAAGVALVVVQLPTQEVDQEARQPAAPARGRSGRRARPAARAPRAVGAPSAVPQLPTPSAQPASTCGLVPYGTTTSQYLPTSAARHAYTGDGLENCKQSYRLFLPPSGEKPAAGWPVLVYCEFSGFIRSIDGGVIDVQAPGRFERHQATTLENGIAVITATCTVSDVVGGKGWNGCDPVELDERLEGIGLFHPPGTDIGGVTPYEDLTYDMAEKDMVMLIQHVRHHGGQQGHVLEDIDRTRVAVMGNSAGAVAMMWPAFGPDRRALFQQQSDPFYHQGQYLEPTRADAAVFVGGMVWWPVYQSSQIGRHFGRFGALDVAAADLGEATLADQVGNSALGYEDVAANQQLPTYLLYEENFCQDTVSPFEEALERTEVNIHTAWNGLAWAMAHPQTRLALGCAPLSCQLFNCPSETSCKQSACGDARAYVKARSLGLVGSENLVLDEEAQIHDMICWLVEEFRDAVPVNAYTTPWRNLGKGFAGSSGAVAALHPSGTLEAGTIVRLQLSGGPPNSLVQLRVMPRVGATGMASPFCAPTLGARFTRVYTTDADGTLSVDLLQGELPPVNRLLYQMLLIDPGVPCGYSTTDILESRAP